MKNEKGGIFATLSYPPDGGQRETRIFQSRLNGGRTIPQGERYPDIPARRPDLS